MEFTIKVVNKNSQTGIVKNWSYVEAQRDWKECGSIDGGKAYLIGYCPAFGIESVLDVK